MRRLVIAVSTVLPVILLAGCAGNSHPAHRSSATTQSSTTSTTTVPASTTTLPSGGPVPSGFNAVSYTAVSADEYWLLGAAPCGNSECTSIIRTTDGGAHFLSIPAPPAPLSGTVPASSVGIVDTLRFADPSDGYVFGRDESNALWVTHDGGAHWSSVALGRIDDFAIGDGEAYALVSECSSASCSNVHMEHSSANSNNWTTTQLPNVAAESNVSMWAHGNQIWVIASTSNSSGDILLESSDAGATFTTRSNPCTPGLNGRVQAVSANVLWFVCATGMMAEAMRSTDGGASFHSVNTNQNERAFSGGDPPLSG